MAMDRQRAELHRRHGHRSVTVRARIADAIRKLIAFLFTQVGVCALIVGYTVIGAFMFIALESEYNAHLTREVTQQRSRHVDLLWNITHHLNVLHAERWRQDVNRTISDYQESVVRSIRRGYDGSEVGYLGWTIPSALMYCITVYTTIGYGNLTPKTGWGKLATVFYALAGIPLMLLYMSNVGDILATSFKYTYKQMCTCPRRRRHRPPHKALVVRLAKSKEPVMTSSTSSTAAMTSPPDTGTQGIAVISIPTKATKKNIEKQSGRLEAEAEAENVDPETVSVKSCLLVMLVFVVGGAVLFSVWEGWGYIDGSYFCFTSLLTIGFGDFVPGHTLYKSAGDQHHDAVDSKLIICAVYLLVGMALLAMCFNLMQEEVFMKIKRFGRQLGLLRERLEQ